VAGGIGHHRRLHRRRGRGSQFAGSEGLGRVGHALGAWAVATVVVVAAAALMPASATSVASNLVGPTYAASARVAALSNVPGRETLGSTARSATQAQIDEARKHFAYAMFASFCALLLGAGAAYAAGIATSGDSTACNLTW
jgi:hypothetical protein